MVTFEDTLLILDDSYITLLDADFEKVGKLNIKDTYFDIINQGFIECKFSYLTCRIIRLKSVGK
jgi:hypothetical protein